MKLLGLMITKDDEEIFGDWCADQLPLYDAVVCLDGSVSGATARLASRFERVIYVHENDCRLASRTDHGLRAAAHEEIVRRFGVNNWVMCCHCDEFCYHDPRKVAAKAQSEGYDCVSWYSLHFYPHRNDKKDWHRLQGLPIQRRLRHYHWDYRHSGLPWLEDRLYCNGARVRWDGHSHGNVRPWNLDRPAPYHPILRHYKVVSLDVRDYEAAGEAAHYRSHWQSLPQRTGLPFPVQTSADFFVAAIPHYARCDTLDERIDQPWNMGEEFRPQVREVVPLR